MKLNILLSGLCLLLSGMNACQTPRAAQPGTSPTDQAHNSSNALDWEGAYTGILPCADCQGIQTMIKLNKDLTFILETQYLGKSTGIQKKEGTFSWHQSGNAITLNNLNKDMMPAFYAVGENSLTQLDLKGNKIKGDLSEKYVLKKETSGIAEKYWKLTELNGKKVRPSANSKREAHLILKAAGHRLTGNTGCNSFTGSYALMSGNRIRISKVAATKMACINMETEDQLFKVFEITDNYTVKGDTLWLNKARMAPLARFEVVYLR